MLVPHCMSSAEILISFTYFANRINPYIFRKILLVSGRAFTAADQKSQAKGTLRRNAVDVLG